MTNTFKLTHEDNQGKIAVALSGQLTINSIDKIVDRMKEVLKKPTEVSIKVKDVENMDLTFIQLLFSIKNSGKKDNFKVEFDINVSDELKMLISNAGFQNILN